ncbi:katanin p60 ATPase-containing subunit A-like 2 [Colletes gigas]|uniref:katanin p60 ATPase-containing subunit A-like 2 n=1 Tax=Colletes gigas TaxID=935657 RepID=UPI001C9B23F2|nr:katanin p60 ATPase-containing subunit A-like 2 [Colletes gigas]
MNNLTLDGSTDCVNHNLKEKENKRGKERRRHLLHLIVAYLENQSLTESANTLITEAHLSKDIQVCDNMDLEMILLEYNIYYQMKFNKHPILCKRVVSSDNKNVMNSKQHNKVKNTNKARKETNLQTTNSDSNNDINDAITVKSIFHNECDDVPAAVNAPQQSLYSKISKSIENLYTTDSELHKMAEVVSKEIVLTNLNVHWDDVKGLGGCKTVIKEAVVYPLKYPFFFNEKFSPWKGILLYGPPGTGKTMLAKAVATECNCTFFNITASSLVSKWRGDSEKYIRVLFDLAYQQSPTIIFIDEIDWIATKIENSSLSEPARRFRAELLTRLDGVTSQNNSNVVLMATTNAPWNIDAALLRRLEKHIYVSLPDSDTRYYMLQSYISPHLDLHDSDIIRKTAHYSGADIKMLCKQAWMLQETPTWIRHENKEVSALKSKYEISDLDYLMDALKYVRPTASELIPKYTTWQESLTTNYSY